MEDNTKIPLITISADLTENDEPIYILDIDAGTGISISIKYKWGTKKQQELLIDLCIVAPLIIQRDMDLMEISDGNLTIKTPKSTLDAIKLFKDKYRKDIVKWSCFSI